MSNLITQLESSLAGLVNTLDTKDSTLIYALRHLEKNVEVMCHLKGKKKLDEHFLTFIKPLLEFEDQSKGKEKSWRIVVDMATEDDIYSSDPIIQICSGEPLYHRFVITFGENGVTTKMETTSVEENPDLSAIKSQSDNPQTLSDIKDFYDKAQIQRIAILGSARVFAHPDFIDSEEPSKGQQAPNKDHKRAQDYNKRVEIELNKFLDVMEEEGTTYLTVNGGWAGVNEGSTGIPLISSLIGSINDADHGFSMPPLTVMPKVGAFDRVTTRADAYQQTPIQSVSEDIIPDIHTYFEVPGTWGDDSKYLVGLSTGLLIFEPYGFWTNIEIANGVAQHKPVAVILDPKNLDPGEKYYEQMIDGQTFVEVVIPLPGDAQGTYRLYRDAKDAAQWLHETTVQNLQINLGAAPDNSAVLFRERIRILKEDEASDELAISSTRSSSSSST